MAAHKTARDEGVGRKWKHFAAGGPYILDDPAADAPEGVTWCARLIVPLAAGSFSMIKDSGENDAPIANFYQGFVHEADTYAFTCNVACVVYW